MPTTLRSFPQQQRSGTQQTPYTNIPNKFDFIRLLGNASAATFSDEGNTIRFEVLHADTVNGGNEQIIQVEQWTGGLITPHDGSAEFPRAVDITFGPVPDAGFIALRAIFNRAITIGADLIGLP